MINSNHAIYYKINESGEKVLAIIRYINWWSPEIFRFDTKINKFRNCAIIECGHEIVNQFDDNIKYIFINNDMTLILTFDGELFERTTAVQKFIQIKINDSVCNISEYKRHIILLTDSGKIYIRKNSKDYFQMLNINYDNIVASSIIDHYILTIEGAVYKIDLDDVEPKLELLSNSHVYKSIYFYNQLNFYINKLKSDVFLLDVDGNLYDSTNLTDVIMPDVKQFAIFHNQLLVVDSSNNIYVLDKNYNIRVHIFKCTPNTTPITDISCIDQTIIIQYEDDSVYFFKYVDSKPLFHFVDVFAKNTIMRKSANKV